MTDWLAVLLLRQHHDHDLLTNGDMPTAQQLNGFNIQLPIIGEITQLDANARTLDVRGHVRWGATKG
jgi:hypothetical protein